MSPASTACVLGLDVGGTSTRALLADTSGRRLGCGSAGGGNPISRGETVAAANIASAAGRALANVDPSDVAATVVGGAGFQAFREGDSGHLLDEVWRQLGLRCPVSLVADAEVAYAAGTAEPDGTVLIAGTGAVAVDIAKRRRSGKRADGYGWLLGDLGSGIWLGRQAVYAALLWLDGNGPGGPLVESVLHEIAPEVPDVNGDFVVRRVMDDEPVRLSRLSPLVTAAAVGKDPTACDIVDRAVAHLCDTVSAVRAAQSDTPVVLAGSLAAQDTPVSRGLRTDLARRHPAAPVLTAHDGAAGAAWIAGRELVADEAAVRRLHQALVS